MARNRNRNRRQRNIRRRTNKQLQQGAANGSKFAKIIVENTKPRRTRRRRRSTQPSVVGRGIREIGSRIGSYLGLGNLGRELGGAVSRVTGFGDYYTNSPKVNSLYAGGGPPAFSPLSSGFRIKHREYIRDVSSSVAFGGFTMEINPANALMFPWLSSVAVNFEEYRIMGMVVYLNTSSGTAIANVNTALGVWGLVTQYDPNEPDFTTKQQCENYVGCQAAIPSQSILHGIECAPESGVLERKFVANGDIPIDQMKFYHWGKLQYFTQGSQNANVIGEMWVSYDIEFTKPRLPTAGYLAYSDYYYVQNICTNANNMGNQVQVPKDGSTIGTTIAGANNDIAFPPGSPEGYYMIIWQWDWTTANNTTTPTATATGSISGFVNVFSNGGSAIMEAPDNGRSTTAQMFGVVCKKIGPGPGTVHLVNAVFTGNCSCDIMITRVSAELMPQLKKQMPLTYAELEKIRAYIQSLGLPALTTEEETDSFEVIKTTTQCK